MITKHTMISKHTISLCWLSAALLTAGWPLAPSASAGDRFDQNDKALATFNFEGVSLPTNPAELEQIFPAAKRNRQRVDEQIGLACYEVRDLPNADYARFYFCDDRLYQVEIRYNLARVEKLGGMQAVVQKLIDAWGPADHIGQSRWTWQRPTYQRRADFYSWPDRAKLRITDTSWMPVVQKRIERQNAATLDLGF